MPGPYKAAKQIPFDQFWAKGDLFLYQLHLYFTKRY